MAKVKGKGNDAQEVLREAVEVYVTGRPTKFFQVAGRVVRTGETAEKGQAGTQIESDAYAKMAAASLAL